MRSIGACEAGTEARRGRADDARGVGLGREERRGNFEGMGNRWGGETVGGDVVGSETVDGGAVDDESGRLIHWFTDHGLAMSRVGCRAGLVTRQCRNREGAQ